MPPVEMPAHEDAQARTAPPAPLFVDLQHHAVEHEGVVPRHAALFLMAEDLVEVLRAPPGARAKRAL
jgi:hypothetical protein